MLIQNPVLKIRWNNARTCSLMPVPPYTHVTWSESGLQNFFASLCICNANSLVGVIIIAAIKLRWDTRWENLVFNSFPKSQNSCFLAVWCSSQLNKVHARVWGTRKGKPLRFLNWLNCMLSKEDVLEGIKDFAYISYQWGHHLCPDWVDPKHGVTLESKMPMSYHCLF